MFRLTDNAIAPHKTTFERAKARLPEAHHQAHLVATAHLHRRVTEAAVEAGFDSSSVVMGRGTDSLYVGIGFGPEGDRLAAHEFGLPDTSPMGGDHPAHGTLRKTAMRARPEAQAIYNAALWQGLGG